MLVHGFGPIPPSVLSRASAYVLRFADASFSNMVSCVDMRHETICRFGPCVIPDGAMMGGDAHRTLPLLVFSAKERLRRDK